MNQINRTRSATGVTSSRLILAVGLGAATVLGHLPGSARGCNTPVFRYAMYNWPTAPYYLFFFHHGPVAEQDQEVNKTIGKLSQAEPPVNIALQQIDLSQEKPFEGLPEVVQKAWKSHAAGEQPLHLVFSPWPAEPYPVRLDAKQLQALVDSPVRQRLGKLFDEGNAAVLLILTGPDEEANQRAEKVAGEVASQAAGGKIPVAGGDDFGPDQFLPETPGTNAADAPAEDDQHDSSDALRVAVLKVARTDPAETWLVRILLSVEPDLREDRYAKDPMVFAVYGRGRAMPPYVGKGINVENLFDCVAFLAGACSCMVKDQNPGVDLLMRWDWDATAEKMAADDPQFSGPPWGYQEFALEEPGPETEAARPEDRGAKQEVSEVASREDVPSEPSPATTDPQPRAVKPSSAEEVPAEIAPAAGARDDAAPTSGAGQEADSFAAGEVWKLGTGLAVGAVIVLAAGLALICRQRPV